MKIAWFRREISPEVGCYIAGYGTEDISVKKTDDLYMVGLCADDGERRVLIVSFDLIGLDEWYSRQLRRECAEILGTDPNAVLLTCTHNHTGPETRSNRKAPDHLNTPYLEAVERKLLEEVRGLHDFRECDVYFYSQKCDENRNRRYVTACNQASFTPHRRVVVPIAQEYADKELGELCFVDSKTRQPLYVVGNYAAHPLAGHAPGLGGIKISADFPGYFRDYVTEETGAAAMFISGAAGDLVPREDELGSKAAEQTGVNLAKAAIGGLVDCVRNPARFKMENARVGCESRIVTVPLRKRPNRTDTGRTAELEMQIVSIGDICFVGVPGELCCELGQEIKWHSPFRRAYIAYAATAYVGYLVSTNMMLAGGYEGGKHNYGSRTGLALVNAAVDGMYALHERVFPEAGEAYPDCLELPLVNIPANR